MIITLTTDFGDSEYVGAMKGVIASVNPDARVIDLTHGIRRHSIRHGAYALMTAVPHFPFAVHVAVVDPGVGTDRRALAIACEGAYLVGPDNGVLIPAARRLGMKEVRRIENPALLRPKISSTFHGRDVFAPVAAHLAAGVKFREVGAEASTWTDLDFGAAVPIAGGWKGAMICADGFGNVVTNIAAEAWLRQQSLGESFDVAAGTQRLQVRYLTCYGDGKAGELVCLVGSGGYLELAVNQGSAEEVVGAHEGVEVSLTLRR